MTKRTDVLVETGQITPIECTQWFDPLRKNSTEVGAMEMWTRRAELVESRVSRRLSGNNELRFLVWAAVEFQKEIGADYIPDPDGYLDFFEGKLAKTGQELGYAVLPLDVASSINLLAEQEYLPTNLQQYAGYVAIARWYVEQNPIGNPAPVTSG